MPFPPAPRVGPSALFLLTLVFLVPASPAEVQTGPELEEIFEDFFEQYLELHPVFASSIGEQRYNDRLTLDLLPAHREQRAALYESTRAALSKVPRASLYERHRLHLEALDYALELFAQQAPEPGGRDVVAQGVNPG